MSPRDEVTSGFWERVEARYRPPRGPAILEDVSATSKVPVFSGVFSTLNAVLVTILLLAYDEPLAAWVGLTIVLTYLVATVFYLFTGRGDVFIHFMLWASIGQNIAIHVLLGGFVWSGGFLMWGIIVSTTATLFLGRRTAVAITVIYVVGAVALIFLEGALRTMRGQPDPTLSALLAFDVFVVSLAIVVPIVFVLIRQVVTERQRAESLLLNVLPEPVADRLKRSPGVIADRYEACTVLFADLVGFTDHASRITPEQLIHELNTVFSRFDGLVAEVGAEKIKTVGDGYLAVAGVPTLRPDHVDVMCDLGLRLQEAMPTINLQLGAAFGLRVGIATGRLVAGVVGTARFSYDLWGDTVNLASRMETLSDPGTIRVTAPVAAAGGGLYRFDEGGVCDVKGLGPMQTYVLVGRASAVVA